VTSASDAPNVPADWRQGVATALLREGRSGVVSGPGERIGLRDALHTYTTAGAWQDDADRWKGSLERGMAADVCVLDARLLDGRGRMAVDPHEIPSMPVAWTVVNGAVAYDAGDAPATATTSTAAYGIAPDARPEQMCAHC
jgi:predicted amidohydrolase YtcJ